MIAGVTRAVVVDVPKLADHERLVRIGLLSLQN